MFFSAVEKIVGYCADEIFCINLCHFYILTCIHIRINPTTKNPFILLQVIRRNSSARQRWHHTGSLYIFDYEEASTISHSFHTAPCNPKSTLVPRNGSADQTQILIESGPELTHTRTPHCITKKTHKPEPTRKTSVSSDQRLWRWRWSNLIKIPKRQRWRNSAKQRRVH